jgi:hypothetical protein
MHPATKNTATVTSMAQSLSNHRRPAEQRQVKDPRFQVLFCIDDREEGIRRHIEKLSPRHETFGVAGFFGVAVDYRGLDDANSAFLCPVVVTPRHQILEQPQPEHGHVAQTRARLRALWGRLDPWLHNGTHSRAFQKTFLGGVNPEQKLLLETVEDLLPRERLAALAVIGTALAWGRADPLSAVPHVERILHLAAAQGVLWLLVALVALGGLFLPMAHGVAGLRSTRSETGAMAVSLGAYFGAALAVTELGNFPVPVLGAGAGHVLGWYSALGILRSSLPPSASTNSQRGRGGPLSART